MRERLTSAVLMVNAIDNVRRRIISLKEIQAKFEGQLAARTMSDADAKLLQAELPMIRNGISTLERTNQTNFRYYSEQVLGLAKIDFSRTSAAFSAIKDDFSRRQLPEFDKAFEVTRKHVEEASTSRNGVQQGRIDSWFKDIDLRQRR